MLERSINDSDKAAFKMAALDVIKDYAIMELDPDGIIISCNDGITQVKGYKKEEVIGKSFAIFYNQEDRLRGHPQALLENAIAHNKCEEEGWRIRKDGTQFWAEGVLTRVNNANGELIGFSKITRNSQKTLMQTFSSLQKLNAISDIVTWTRDNRGAFIDPQPSWQAFTGQTPEEYFADDGFGWLKMVPTSEHAKIKEFWQIPSFDPKEIETLIWSQQSKSYHHVLTRTTSQITGDSVRWIGIDVGIQALKQTESRMQDALDKLTLTVSAAHMGLWEIDMAANKITIDKTVANFFDIDLEKFSGNLTEVIDKIHPDDRASVLHSLKSAFEKQEFYDVEFRVIRKDGATEYLAGHGEVKLINGKTSHLMMGLNWNITAKKIEAKQIHEIKQELLIQAKEFERNRAQEAEKNRERYKEYLDNMCHELRNPQNAISLSITALREDLQVGLKELLFTKLLPHLQPKPPSTPEQEVIDAELMNQNLQALTAIFDDIEENLDIASTTVADQGETINDLLDLSKGEDKKLQLNPVVFNLPLIVETVLKSYILQAKAKNIDLSWKIQDTENFSEENFFILADRDKLKRVLSNLLSNAIKYTPTGFINIHCTIQPGEDHNHSLLFRIEDSGIGIDPELLPKIFDRFSSASTTVSSSGLGLHLTKSFVQIMGGIISVASEKNKGSLFQFSVPCRRLSLREIAEFKSSEENKVQNNLHQSSEKRIYSILIVDDTVINHKLLKKMLSKVGHNCEVANDGLEAVEKSRKDHYDIIFMDIFMPHMNGYQATINIREHEAKTNSKKSIIIGLSANAGPDHSVRALESGMNYYITKPVHPSVLFKTIEDCHALMVSMSQPSNGPPVRKNSLSSDETVLTPLSFFQPSTSPHITIEKLKEETQLISKSGIVFTLDAESKKIEIRIKDSKPVTIPESSILEDLRVHLNRHFRSLVSKKIPHDPHALHLEFKSEEDALQGISFLKQAGLNCEVTSKKPAFLVLNP